jgi:hypothetical protein
VLGHVAKGRAVTASRSSCLRFTTMSTVKRNNPAARDWPCYSTCTALVLAALQQSDMYAADGNPLSTSPR